MSTVRKTIDLNNRKTSAIGHIDPAVVDATTETQIAKQQQEDDEEAKLEVARYVRRLRKREARSQVELARRICVPVQTVRDWEHGKEVPTEAARALLRVLDEAPETVLRILT